MDNLWRIAVFLDDNSGWIYFTTGIIFGNFLTWVIIPAIHSSLAKNKEWNRQ